MLYLHLLMRKIYYLPLFILLIQISCVEQGHLKVNTVVQHISSQPDGLHPYNDNSATRSFIFEYTQKGITRLDLRTLEQIPHLVDSLARISKDGLKYHYRLKEGIKWDDGSPLTAEDIKFSTKLMICPLTDNSQIRSIYSSVIKSIETYPEDPLKFTMHANTIHVNNKTILGGVYVQQKKIWDPLGVLDNVDFTDINNPEWKPSKEIEEWFISYNHADNSYKPEKLLGLGPYQVTQFVTGQYVIIEKKNNWWGQNDTSIYNAAKPDKIIFKIITDDNSTYYSLKNERIDASTAISTKKFLNLRKNEDFNKNYHSEFLDRFGLSYIGLNMKPDGIKHKKFFTDKKVRRAMAYLTPVDKIIDVVLYGEALRQTSNVSPLKKTYNDTLKEIPLDIEKAKQLLDESGWIDTDGDNIRDKIIDGIKTPFSFRFSYMKSPVTTQIVLMIQETMKKAGVDIIPNPMDFSLFYDRAKKHEFDAMLGGWASSASYSDPMQLWHTSSWVTKGSNFCGFGDAESDALINLANTSIDPEKHRNASWKLQARIYDEQPYIFLFASKQKVAIHKRFDNANMYIERPAVILNNFELNTNYEAPTQDL